MIDSTLAELGNLHVPDLDAGELDEDAPVELGPDGELPAQGEPECMDRDAFWIVFRTCFDVPGIVMPDLAVMAIRPDEERRARAASDATYALLSIYYPSALVPGGETFAHLMVAGPFFIAKAMAVRAVMAAKRAKPVNPPEPPRAASRPAPANDDAQPIGDGLDWARAA